MELHRVVLAGGSGFLGRLVAANLAQRGAEVVILSRRPRSRPDDRVREVAWDGYRLGPWAELVDGADGVFNFAGRSVDCRYHARNRRSILESRVATTRIVGEAIAASARPPRVWLNASTATIYRHSYDEPMDEGGAIGATPEAKDAFSLEVAVAWEAALNAARTPQTRRVVMRTAMVLGHGRNSVFPVLRRLARLGLGGTMGDGRQYVSWIHAADFCRAVAFLLDHDSLSGPVNLAAPEPLPNAEFMRRLRAACGIRVGLPATRWMLECGAFLLRTETELILKSRRVVPGRLVAAGFNFSFPSLDTAFADLLGRTASTQPAG